MKSLLTKLFWVGAILLVAQLLVPDSRAISSNEPSNDQPSVVKAVAPPFIPWVFNEPGETSATVEVLINPEGTVTDAKVIEVSLFRDVSFEQTARKWIFAPSGGKEMRKATLTFVLRIMPKETKWSDVTTIYTAPYQIEVRHEIFDSSPIPHPPISTKP